MSSDKQVGPETDVLVKLVKEHFPTWISEMRGFVEKREAEKRAALETMEDEGVDDGEDVMIGPVGPKPKAEFTVSNHSAELEKQVLTTGADRLHQQPNYGKVRFSSLTGPVIMYDGEGQEFLFKMWTKVAEQRGNLRKEMMSIRRKLPADKRRLQPVNDITEKSDGFLDKATKFIETASFLMLKGELYKAHMLKAADFFNDALKEIQACGCMEPRAKTPEPAAFGSFDESDGDGTLEADDGTDADEEEPILTLPPSRFGRNMPPRPIPRSSAAGPSRSMAPPAAPTSQTRNLKRPIGRITPSSDTGEGSRIHQIIADEDEKIEADDTIEADDSDTSMPDIKLSLPPRRSYGPQRRVQQTRTGAQGA